MINVVSKKQKLALTLPTNLSEITPEYLSNVTRGIQVADHHCVIALVQKTNLFDICALYNSKKNDKTVSVTTIMAKCFENKYPTGNVVVTDRSSIERGIHVNVPTGASSTTVINFLDADEELRKNIITGKEVTKDGVSYSRMPIYVIEFKILPITDIHGCVDRSVKIDDAFAVRTVEFKEETAE